MIISRFRMNSVWFLFTFLLYTVEIELNNRKIKIQKEHVILHNKNADFVHDFFGKSFNQKKSFQLKF